MEPRRTLYEGKAKIVYETDDPGLLIQHFKDSATAFDGQKHGVIANKGVFNCAISSALFQYLEKNGVATHFVGQLSEREMLIKRLEIIPVEVIVRNRIAGSLAKRTGREEGEPLPFPILEYYLKSDELGDPMINAWHIRVFRWASDEEMGVINETALRINDLLGPYFDERGVILADFKLEFGRHADGLLLGDEISPDGCRLWDKATGEKLDKDRFRRDLGRLEESYEEVWRRVCQP
ncbi:MAG: phosphoribosylaminoimidazolesuccinocarboxamide synthase [Candidatus Tectimicrobiota bacterium]